MKKVKDVMSKNVIYFSPEDSIFYVAKVFSKKKIAGAPVVERGKVIGMISVTDIVKFLRTKLRIKGGRKFPSLSLLVLDIIQSGKNFIDLKRNMKKMVEAKVKNVMKKKVISIQPEASIFDAANLMEKKDVSRLPVISDGKLVGIVTRKDLLKMLID